MNFIGAHIIELNQVDSTNSALKLLIKKEELPEGTLLIAKEQKKGRGQLGKGWISEKSKNFTGTYLLNPKLDLQNVFVLNLIISLAVKNVAEDYLSNSKKEVKIKWPNDILVDRKKIAGILIENQIQSVQILNSFIGIGFNINQINFPEFNRKATSLGVELNHEFSIENFTERLSIHIQQFYMLYKTIGAQALYKLYLESLYLIDEWAIYLTPEKKELMLKKVDKSGQLLLINKQGEELIFGIKEIKFTK